MAQHINTNQLHPAMVNQIPMLQAAGLNLTIMTGQQHGLPQFAQGQPGMYQIVQQAPGQLQMQNVVHQQQHQLNNIHLQQQQQQQHIQQPQIAHQQVQQLSNHHQLNNHAQIQQIQLHQNQQIHQQLQQGQHHDNTPTTKGGKKKKSKVNKDGVPAPKRATTAYINFTQWYRESIKKSGKIVPKIGEFGKECANKWGKMSEEEKKPFTEVAARDRDRYRREMEIYKPARDANKPKRPGTAFMLFMVDLRKEIAGKEPEGGVAALAKLGGERWRGMTDEEKKPYVEQQNECKIRYEAAMEEYRKMNGQASNSRTPNPSVEGIKEEKISELNSIGDSDTSEHQTNLHSHPQQNNENLEHDTDQLQQTQQNHNSPGSSTSPHTQALSPSPSNQQTQDGQQSSSINNLTGLNMANFTSNDDFNTNFVQQSNSSESNMYQQQQHEQIDQQQHLEQHLDQQHDQQHDQQNSSQYTQNYNQHYTWN